MFVLGVMFFLRKSSAPFPLKKLNVKKNKMKLFFFLKSENFLWNHPPKRHIKNKTMHFAHCKKSFMANKLLSTNLERLRFLRRINSPLKS